MRMSKLMAVLIGAGAMLMVAQPAMAQRSAGGVPPAKWAPNVPPGNAVDPPEGTAITRDNLSGSRLNRQRQEERRQAERRRRAERGEAVAPASMTPERSLAAARRLAASLGLDCQMTEASHPGVTPDEAPIYEAACADGPGFVLVASEPAQSFNCFDLAGAAALARREDPNADPGLQCELPANQNAIAVIGGWAREAGVTCQIDQAAAIGRTANNNVLYEVGCGAERGYWLEKTAAGWSTQTCEAIASAGDSCLFRRTARN